MQLRLLQFFSYKICSLQQFPPPPPDFVTTKNKYCGSSLYLSQYGTGKIYVTFFCKLEGHKVLHAQPNRQNIR